MLNWLKLSSKAYSPKPQEATAYPRCCKETRLPTQIKEAAPEPRTSSPTGRLPCTYDHTRVSPLAHQMPGASLEEVLWIKVQLPGQTQKLPWPISQEDFQEHFKFYFEGHYNHPGGNTGHRSCRQWRNTEFIQWTNWWATLRTLSTEVMTPPVFPVLWIWIRRNKSACCPKWQLLDQVTEPWLTGFVHSKAGCPPNGMLFFLQWGAGR